MDDEITGFFNDQEVFVTGGAGFVGWHVADRLQQAGARVRILARGDAPDCERFQIRRGDLLEPGSLRNAMSGCRYVFHVAGDYRFWARDRREILRNNVEGTRNLLEVARQLAVERIVCTSSPGILARCGSAIGDETQLARRDELEGPYKKGKFFAYQEVERAVEQGAPVVTVLPTAPIGFRDVKPTPTGKIIVDFINGKIPFLARTGLNFVDVRSAALGHLQAMIRGQSGQRYLLGGVNLWLGEFLQLIEPFTSRKAPRHHAPHWLSCATAMASEAIARLTGRAPFVTREAVRMSRQPHFFSSEKAQRELGFDPVGIEPALREAVEYFRSRDFLR
jgi:dihydroflavonol-4-reductase